MSLSHLYQNFSSLPASDTTVAPFDQDRIEDAKLQSFETGYKAGWEDAIKAQETAKDRIASDFAQNLQDMSFTFHEASTKLSLAMKPFLSQIVSKILPDLTDKIIAAQAVSQMIELMEAQSETAIQIVVSPKNLDALTDLLAEKSNIPFQITAEPALGEGQVYLRANAEEREINLDAVKHGISNALDAFFQQLEQEDSDD